MPGRTSGDSQRATWRQASSNQKWISSRSRCTSMRGRSPRGGSADPGGDGHVIVSLSEVGLRGTGVAYTTADISLALTPPEVTGPADPVVAADWLIARILTNVEACLLRGRA